MLFQGVKVAFVPFDELSDALMQPHDGLVADLRLEPGGVSIGLIDVAGLHGQELLLRLHAERLLDFGDEVHEFHGVGAADVIDAVPQAVRIRLRQVVQTADGAGDDVVDEGEVADHVAVVEHLDGLPLRDGPRKQHRRHIRPAPGAVDGEIPQARHGDAIQLAVAVGHQFVGLLGGGVQGDGVVDLVVLAVRDLGIHAVDAGGRGVNQVFYLIVPTRLQDVQEPHEIALQIRIRVRDAIPHPRLRGEIHDLVELLRREEFIDGLLVGQVHLPDLQPERLAPALLQPDIVIIVIVVDSHDLIPPLLERVHELGTDKTGRAGHKYFHGNQYNIQKYGIFARRTKKRSLPSGRDRFQIENPSIRSRR